MAKIETLVPAQGEGSVLSDEAAIARLRLVGVYDDRQEGFFMLRTRIPGGRLTWQQAEVLGQLADQISQRPEAEREAPERFIEITTRQDIQTHWIRVAHLPEIWRRYRAVGLTSLQACGDTARNITACPVAGIDRDEVMDVTPVVDALNRYVLEHPEYGSGLPRKFKIAVTGCREDCTLTRINDLAFSPARLDGETGFNVWAGGGLSDYPRLASDLDLFVTPDQVVPVSKAIIAVYKEFGDYESKAVNRFRRLVDDLGPDRIRAEAEGRAEFRFRRAGTPLTAAPRYDHVGIYVQRQPGVFYVGLAVPVGRMQGQELVQLAHLARDFGDGGLRLTPRQDVVITGVPEARLSALLARPLLQTFSPQPRTFSRSVVACTSAPFCKYGIFNMKDHGVRLAQVLDEAVGDGIGPIRLHLSGCKASCAQPQIADIGLRASLARDETGYQEAFDVAVGGDLQQGRLTEWIALEVPASHVYDGLQRLLRVYREERRQDEAFTGYLERAGTAYLRQILQESAS